MLDLGIKKRFGACTPPPWRSHSGVASCDVEVGQWDEVPPLFKSGNAPLIAGSFTGMCKRCQRDIDSQRSSLSPGDAQTFVAIDDVIPKRSFKNCMDPCWTFPHHELADLFRHATTTEAMLVALEHMQVSWVTVYRTHLHRFKKNVISFPQDSVGFFSRFGVLKQYRVGDRVNSFRGPGADVGRSAQLASESSDQVLQAHAVDNLGHVVFGATVSHVFADGTLRLQYDDYSEFGDEAADSVRPRIQMPWHPRFLKDSLIVLLRRNIGHGRVLEGLEVRWSYVVRLMQALTKLGRCRMETSLGPCTSIMILAYMTYCQKRMFCCSMLHRNIKVFL